MVEEQKGVMAAGFSLLWRRQGVLWWVFVVNFVCGALGSLPATLRLVHALHHTLAGRKLSDGFDLGMLVELMRLPDVNILRYSTTSYLFALVFFVFMLFVTGGILETYRLDRRLNTAEFFAASGAFFWRFVRLGLLSIVLFVIVAMIYQALNKAADHIGDRAVADQVGIFLSLAAFGIFLLLALWVRLWFDMAQVRAVVQNERGMWRNTWKSWRNVWKHLGRLFWMYFAIALLAWIVTVICLVIWARLSPTALPATFLLLEVIVFAQLAARLWQLAAAMTWYQQHAEIAPVQAVDYSVTPPREVVEPSVAPPLELPPRDPGPELPPADA
jgi:hypothetical protein